jgi:hypothetical protein
MSVLDHPWCRCVLGLFLRVIHHQTSRAAGSETRMTAIPSFPGGVESAYIVLRCASESVGSDLAERVV